MLFFLSECSCFYTTYSSFCVVCSYPTNEMQTKTKQKNKKKWNEILLFFHQKFHWWSHFNQKKMRTLISYFKNVNKAPMFGIKFQMDFNFVFPKQSKINSRFSHFHKGIPSDLNRHRTEVVFLLFFLKRNDIIARLSFIIIPTHWISDGISFYIAIRH